MFKKTLLSFTVLCSAMAISNAAQAEESLERAFKEGTPYIDARYRYEFADQDGIANDAHASTLRTRLGYKSGAYHGVSGVLELENITQLGSDNYNDTLNGRTDHPVVADVESTEVNQAFLQYSGIPDTQVRFGREAINLDNQRFIGSVGWRQNDQTLDNVNIINSSLKDTKLMYSYVNNANRIFGDDSAIGDWKMNSHLVNLSNSSLSIGKIGAYGYLLDIEDALAMSAQTYGISLNGAQKLSDDWKFKYHLEYARQSDYGDNPTSYDADYYHIAPSISWKGLSTTVGYEVLGSDDGAVGFSTPLATLHKFNGWADKFLATPATGLEDFYVDVTYKFGKCDYNIMNDVMVKAQYHDFSADEGGADYGSEYGIFVKKKFNKHYSAHAKFSDYNADSFSTDTKRFTLGLGVKY